MLRKIIISLLFLFTFLNQTEGFFKNNFTTSEKGKTFIKEKEGYSEIAYFDGTWTIGYGNTFYPDGKPVKKGDRITTDQGSQILDYVLKTTFEPRVNELVISKINQSQFDALVSYAYNRGNQRLKTSKLLRMVNQDPQNEAIRQQFVIEWGTNTKFKNGLIRRRKAEAELYFYNSEEYHPITEFLPSNQKFKYMFLIWIASGILLTLLGQFLLKHFNISLKITKK
jgi:lysozyme